MTEGLFPKNTTDNVEIYASEYNNFRNVNLMLVQALNFRTVKSTGYVYWDTGKIRVGNLVYDITGSNSGASKTDKLIIAVLDSGTSTATITFQATNYTFIADEIVLGYVDSSSRLYLFGQSNQPNYSGYTLTTATASINVNGEGYFLGAYANSFGKNDGYSITATASIVVSIDGTEVYNNSDSHSVSASNAGGKFVSASNFFVGPIKFNSNLTITITADVSGSVDYEHNVKKIDYYLK